VLRFGAGAVTRALDTLGRLLDVLFIVATFLGIRAASTDDAGEFAALGEGYQEQAFACRVTDDDLTLLTDGMIWIIEDSRETPCFLRFSRAFAGSHVNCTATAYDMNTGLGVCFMILAT